MKETKNLSRETIIPDATIERIIQLRKEQSTQKKFNSKQKIRLEYLYKELNTMYLNGVDNQHIMKYDDFVCNFIFL